MFLGDEPNWVYGHFIDELVSGYHVFSNEREELTVTLFWLISVGYHLELRIYYKIIPRVSFFTWTIWVLS